nr:hypothetical protein [uncultured bacterium]
MTCLEIDQQFRRVFSELLLLRLGCLQVLACSMNMRTCIPFWAGFSRPKQDQAPLH